jgi:hypothetical protein
MTNCSSFVTCFASATPARAPAQTAADLADSDALAFTRIRRMALAASDDDQQKVKKDIRRYFHGRFHREDSVFRDFRSKHYPPETALTVGPLVMS